MSPPDRTHLKLRRYDLEFEDDTGDRVGIGGGSAMHPWTGLVLWVISNSTPIFSLQLHLSGGRAVGFALTRTFEEIGKF